MVAGGGAKRNHRMPMRERHPIPRVRPGRTPEGSVRGLRCFVTVRVFPASLREALITTVRFFGLHPVVFARRASLHHRLMSGKPPACF